MLRTGVEYMPPCRSTPGNLGANQWNAREGIPYIVKPNCTSEITS